MDCSQNLCEDYSKLAINWKNINDLIISWHQGIVKTFCRCFVSLVKFSCWSTFHVNIINGSGVMTIFFYKWLAINSEIEYTPVFFPIVLRFGQFRDTKFSRNVSNEMLLNAGKCEDYSFYRFWVIKGKTTELVKLTYIK